MACFVIAEAGVNHNGSLDTAKRLVDAARAAEADAVKFQFFISQKLWKNDSIKHLELRFSEFVVLHNYCERVGIEFMCTPFGVEEVVLLKQLLKRWKIASGCLRRTQILEAVRDTDMPVILSTGMSTFAEVREALEVFGYQKLSKFYERDITLLHCTSSYPCAIEDANLLAMKELRWHFGMDEGQGIRGGPCKIGYSDHTLGITVPIAAVAMGAKVIEKHLTLDREAVGPDHKASAEPEEFRVMVSAIRTVEAALGDGVKRVLPCEEALREKWREPAKTDRAS